MPGAVASGWYEPAAHWLHPRVSEVMPFAIVAGLDLALAASLLWIVFELGLREDRPA